MNNLSLLSLAKGLVGETTVYRLPYMRVLSSVQGWKTAAVEKRPIVSTGGSLLFLTLQLERFVLEERLDSNECISLLTWIREYK